MIQASDPCRSTSASASSTVVGWNSSNAGITSRITAIVVSYFTPDLKVGPTYFTISRPQGRAYVFHARPQGRAYVLFLSPGFTPDLKVGPTYFTPDLKVGPTYPKDF